MSSGNASQLLSGLGTRTANETPDDSNSAYAQALFSPTPDQLRDTGVHRFTRVVNAKYGLSLETYQDLYEWSVKHIDAFWGLVWDQTGVVGRKGGHAVDNEALPSDNPVWFKDARLNWAQNMLRERSPSKIAVIEASELYDFHNSNCLVCLEACTARGVNACRAWNEVALTDTPILTPNS